MEAQIVSDVDSKLSIDPSVIYLGSHICVGRGSELIIEKGVKINGRVTITDNCKAVIGANSILENCEIVLKNNTTFILGKNCVIWSDRESGVRIKTNKGNIFISDKVRIESASIVVKFGGVFKMGKFSAIGPGSDIRCEESITMGDYALVSYDVCIYDTNTHPIDWKERRERVNAGYPIGTWEIERPSTKPITIGNDVWIAKGVTITKGAVVGDRCIVGLRTNMGGMKLQDDVTVVSGYPRVFPNKI